MVGPSSALRVQRRAPRLSRIDSPTQGGQNSVSPRGHGQHAARQNMYVVTVLFHLHRLPPSGASGAMLPFDFGPYATHKPSRCFERALVIRARFSVCSRKRLPNGQDLVTQMKSGRPVPVQACKLLFFHLLSPEARSIAGNID